MFAVDSEMDAAITMRIICEIASEIERADANAAMKGCDNGEFEKWQDSKAFRMHAFEVRKNFVNTTGRTDIAAIAFDPDSHRVWQIIGAS